MIHREARNFHPWSYRSIEGMKQFRRGKWVTNYRDRPWICLDIRYSKPVVIALTETGSLVPGLRAKHARDWLLRNEHTVKTVSF